MAGAKGMKPLNIDRRRLCATVVLLLGGGAMAWRAAAQDEQVIKVAVRKFSFTPNDIRLKKGVPVVLEFENDGVLMGFSAPDLNARTDIPVGKVTRLRIVPSKAGSFPFFCDIFCGSGHEDMSGTIVVT